MATGCWATASPRMPPAHARPGTAARNSGCACFPRADVEVFDIWHVGGLRATGSNDFQVTDLFVPEQHTIPLVDFQPPPRRPGPLYAIPMTSTFVSCSPRNAGHRPGRDRSADRDRRGEEDRRSSTVLRDKPLGCRQTWRAPRRCWARGGRICSASWTMWEDAVAGRAMSLRARAAVRLAACHATQCAIQAVDLMYQSAGGAALFQGSRLERCFRDVHAAGQHIAVSMQAKPGAGRPRAVRSAARNGAVLRFRPRSGRPPSAFPWSPGCTAVPR